jgi:hypothetical protein
MKIPAEWSDPERESRLLRDGAPKAHSTIAPTTRRLFGGSMMMRCSSLATLALASALAAASPARALTITPVIDSTITSSPDSTAIVGAINDAIGEIEPLFTDPITVSIDFRYADEQPDGTALGAALALSVSTIYVESYATYVGALMADGKTANDATALAHLPLPLATDMVVTSADARALGQNKSGALDDHGRLNVGGTFDGIVTINSLRAFAFDRQSLTANRYDARQAIEHEIDEVLGLGSFLPQMTDVLGKSAVRPEDLFRYSAPGVVSYTVNPNATSYFAIDGGTTEIAGFNQNANGDFGDWLSVPCPNPHPLVQLAFTCPDQPVDVSATSPEGIALDVIGYDPQTGTTTTTCPGDCGGVLQVTITDLVTCVAIALDSQPVSACTACDLDGDQMVGVNELIKAVSAALYGCPGAATPTPAGAIPTPTPAAGLPTPTPTGAGGASGAAAFTLRDGCDDGVGIDFSVFDSTRGDLVYPGGGLVYSIDSGSTATATLSCIPGDILCFGAIQHKAAPALQWGVGIHGNGGCENCCIACSASQSDPATLDQQLVCQ